MNSEASDLGGLDGRAAGVIGIVGSGTMGSGIAQLACKAGARTLLHDPLPEALARGTQAVHDGLNKEASKGKLTAEQARVAGERLEPVDRLEQLSSCELVIEAAPERLDVKHVLYGRLSEIVSEQCVLASNTSSLPITGVAAGATHPERVVGMHFFNPAPLMRLLEVIAGLLSDERALAIAQATGLAMGKDVIRAADVPGFIVNRCNRPFGLEALRLLQERVADIETIDRIVRLGGGFRMGPFELSDLVGVDTGFDVSKSFYELSFGEPRWRPSPIQARQVAAGLHGRKTGRGYYDYSGEGPHRPADPDPPAGGGDAIVTGEGPVADALRTLAPGQGGPQIVVDGLGGSVDGEPFYAIVPLALVEVTGEAGERTFQSLGLHTERVQPAPAGVLARIVCQLVNESAFALG
ncbi:MAG TPA: 3-hydroxyacyl-CoA dehydrogenase NAD-binding domain-containing protein, partial [Solirubrobacteraceae bacterium]|nr:3-hydroxyacyl-CoA dehydrogenase NAD-binding domain-containing protein [Solirubrobacteraceae bacterium]